MHALPGLYTPAPACPDLADPTSGSSTAIIMKAYESKPHEHLHVRGQGMDPCPRDTLHSSRTSPHLRVLQPPGVHKATCALAVGHGGIQQAQGIEACGQGRADAVSFTHRCKRANVDRRHHQALRAFAHTHTHTHTQC
eukprot:1136307-Pelagomonas_calceolata.AAC.3